MKEDTIEGFKLGADDYVTKPFSMGELLLRINKLISRSSVDKPIVLEKEVLHFGSNQVKFKTFESENFKKEKKRLSKKEIMLLKLLSDRENEVVSRNEILEKIKQEHNE